MKKDKIDFNHIKKIDTRIAKDYPDKKPFALAEVLKNIVKKKTPTPPPKKKGKDVKT